MADSIVKLKVDDDSFNAKIKEAARSFADFGKRVASAGADSLAQFTRGIKTAKTAFEGFNTALKANALVLVSSLAIQAGSALVEMFANWISGADDAADAQAKLNEKLEHTAGLLKEMDSNHNFNTRLAKAAGASTTEILKMNLANAELKMKKAISVTDGLDKNATLDQIKEAQKLYDKAEKDLIKARQDLKVDEVARAHKTGEYAVHGGGGGRTHKTPKETPAAGSIAAQQELIRELTKQWNNAGDGLRDTYLMQLIAAEQVLKKMTDEQKLLRENAGGKLLGGAVQTQGLGNVTGNPLAVSGLSPDLLPQMLSPLQQLNQQIQTLSKVMELAATPEQYAELKAQLEELRQMKDNFTGEGKQDKKQDKSLKEFADKASTFASGLSSISSGLKGMGIELPEGVNQAIETIQSLCSIIQGVNAIISVFSTTSMAANTAAVIANTAALAANTATNFIPFANGGVVHAAGGTVAGNTYSNDQIPAMLNAGEVVLNRAQAGNLASQLQGGMGAMQLSAIITGEQLRLVLNNNGRRTGRGEYVTTNFR